jgi:hypothetical protein
MNDADASNDNIISQLFLKPYNPQKIRKKTNAIPNEITEKILHVPLTTLGK